MVDKSGSVALSNWEDYFLNTEDRNYYRLTNIMVKGLTTKPFTDNTDNDPFDTVEENSQSKVLCCPAVLNGNIKMYPICNNSVCKKKLNIPAGSAIASCRSCGRKLLVKNAKVGIKALLQFAENNKDYVTVTIFLQQLKDVFGDDCISNAMEDSDDLLEKLQCLGSQDFHLSFDSKIVTEIPKHKAQ